MAEAEIEYKDKRSPSIYVKFPVKDGKGLLSNERRTSSSGRRRLGRCRPTWLSPCIRTSTYVLVEADGEKYVVAEGLLEQVKKAVGWERVNVRQKCVGQTAGGHRLPTSVSMTGIPCRAGRARHAGRGNRLRAYGAGTRGRRLLCRAKIRLARLCPVDDKGYFTEEAPGFEGLFYDDANKAITEKLQNEGVLLKLDFITHPYPHDWRTKKPVIFRATEQWFASIDGFRETMLEEIKNVRMTPPWGETAPVQHGCRIAATGAFPGSGYGGCRFRFSIADAGKIIQRRDDRAHVADLFAKKGLRLVCPRRRRNCAGGFSCPTAETTSSAKKPTSWMSGLTPASSHDAVLKTSGELAMAGRYVPGRFRPIPGLV